MVSAFWAFFCVVVLETIMCTAKTFKLPCLCSRAESELFIRFLNLTCPKILRTLKYASSGKRSSVVLPFQ